MKIKIFLVFISVSFNCLAQHRIEPERLALDHSLHIALFHINDSLFVNKQTFVVANQQYVLTKNDTSYSLSNPNFKTDFRAFNSPLPIIQINAPNGIVNEPKRMSTIQYADSSQTLTSYAGIELRGSSSQFFPKKTYDLNFRNDSLGIKNRDVRFGKMRKDDDWILDGLYNEPLRFRSHLSLSLWKKIHQPAYLDKEPQAQSGVEAQFCEIFVNGHFKGIYLLYEQVDRKLLKLVKEDNTGVRGELFQGSSYDGAVTFDSVPPKKNYMRRWGGHDIEYPYPNNGPWDNLYPFTKTVVSGDEAAFAKAIKEQLNLDNIIDYFLFVNALRATDNLGKNIYLARYDVNQPYFYVPWDLDGTFGTNFNGVRTNKTNDFLTNGLLRRLLTENPENFVEKFKARWKALRTNTLETTVLINQQTAVFKKLTESGAYYREQLSWEMIDEQNDQLIYMNEWTRKRLEFLDQYIATLPSKTD